MPCPPTSEALFEDPVKVCISRDQLDPPMEGITGEFHPRMRNKERGTREEFNVVATLEAHHRKGMKNNEKERETEILYSGARDGCSR